MFLADSSIMIVGRNDQTLRDAGVIPTEIPGYLVSYIQTLCCLHYSWCLLKNVSLRTQFRLKPHTSIFTVMKFRRDGIMS